MSLTKNVRRHGATMIVGIAAGKTITTGARDERIKEIILSKISVATRVPGSYTTTRHSCSAMGLATRQPSKIMVSIILLAG